MNAEEIISFISNAEKKTPVKVYLRLNGTVDFGPECHVSVSYTHLDVYKRQGLPFASEHPGKMHASSMAVCPSWPQACIFPGCSDAKGRPVCSVMGSASISARNARASSFPSSKKAQTAPSIGSVTVQPLSLIHI